VLSRREPSPNWERSSASLTAALGGGSLLPGPDPVGQADHDHTGNAIQAGETSRTPYHVG
jgi:hypothetical protein